MSRKDDRLRPGGRSLSLFCTSASLGASPPQCLCAGPAHPRLSGRVTRPPRPGDRRFFFQTRRLLERDGVAVTVGIDAGLAPVRQVKPVFGEFQEIRLPAFARGAAAAAAAAASTVRLPSHAPADPGRSAPPPREEQILKASRRRRRRRPRALVALLPPSLGGGALLAATPTAIGGARWSSVGNGVTCRARLLGSPSAPTRRLTRGAEAATAAAAVAAFPWVSGCARALAATPSVPPVRGEDGAGIDFSVPVMRGSTARLRSLKPRRRAAAVGAAFLLLLRGGRFLLASAARRCRGRHRRSVGSWRSARSGYRR